MTIDSEVLNSKAVNSLCEMYASEYRSQSFATMRDPVPSMLNALGACAGFAAQVAAWRELVLPAQRNPGDFLFYTTPKSGGVLLFGDAANLIITNNRNGAAFGRFFRSLFQLMHTGVSMPMAWVQLAPQGPSQSPDLPGMICLMGAGQVTFKKIC